MHHFWLGNRQSAEEHLVTGMKILESHGDWERAKEASGILAALFRRNRSKAAEYESHSDALLAKLREKH